MECRNGRKSYDKPLSPHLIKDFQPSKYYLGTLCKKEHDFFGTGKSLRNINRINCIQCSYESRVTYKQERHNNNLEQFVDPIQIRKEKNAEYSKKRYIKHKAKIDQKNREYQQKNKEKVARRNKNWYEKNKAEIKERRKQYSKVYNATPRAKILSRKRTQKRKALKAQNHHVAFTVEQLQERFAMFDNCCAYCGSRELVTIEHFIPISKSGPDCLGNIVPACYSCNSSKKDRDPKDWYLNQTFYSIKRWRKILNVLGKTDAIYLQIPLL